MPRPSRKKTKARCMYPLHLLVALAEEKEGIVRPVLEKCGAHPDAIVAEARPPCCRTCPKPPACSRESISRSRSTRFWKRPSTRPIRFKDEFVSTEHLLLAIAEQRSDPAGQLLDRAGRDARRHPEGAGLGARQPAGHRPESRNQVPGARALCPRPDRIRARRASSTR